MGSSMMLLRMLPAATAVLSIVVTLSLFGPLVLYAIARWRANRAGVSDPHLGLKFALHWFATTAFHLALAAGAGLIFAMISPGSGKGDLYRVVFAMLVPAGLILGVHMMLLKRTNDDEVPGVRRLFLGYNLFVTGLIGFISLVMGFQILFAKGSAAPVGHMVGSLVLVYCTAWASARLEARPARPRRPGQRRRGPARGGDAAGLAARRAPAGRGGRRRAAGARRRLVSADRAEVIAGAPRALVRARR